MDIPDFRELRGLASGPPLLGVDASDLGALTRLIEALQAQKAQIQANFDDHVVTSGVRQAQANGKINTQRQRPPAAPAPALHEHSIDTPGRRHAQLTGTMKQEEPQLLSPSAYVPRLQPRTHDDGEARLRSGEHHPKQDVGAKYTDGRGRAREQRKEGPLVARHCAAPTHAHGEPEYGAWTDIPAVGGLSIAATDQVVSHRRRGTSATGVSTTVPAPRTQRPTSAPGHRRPVARAPALSSVIDPRPPHQVASTDLFGSPHLHSLEQGGERGPGSNSRRPRPHSSTGMRTGGYRAPTVTAVAHERVGVCEARGDWRSHLRQYEGGGGQVHGKAPGWNASQPRPTARMVRGSPPTSCYTEEAGDYIPARHSRWQLHLRPTGASARAGASGASYSASASGYESAGVSHALGPFNPAHMLAHEEGGRESYPHPDIVVPKGGGLPKYLQQVQSKIGKAVAQDRSYLSHSHHGRGGTTTPQFVVLTQLSAQQVSDGLNGENRLSSPQPAAAVTSTHPYSQLEPVPHSRAAMRDNTSHTAPLAEPGGDSAAAGGARGMHESVAGAHEDVTRRVHINDDLPGEHVPPTALSPLEHTADNVDVNSHPRPHTSTASGSGKLARGSASASGKTVSGPRTAIAWSVPVAELNKKVDPYALSEGELRVREEIRRGARPQPPSTRREAAGEVLGLPMRNITVNVGGRIAVIPRAEPNLTTSSEHASPTWQLASLRPPRSATGTGGASAIDPSSQVPPSLASPLPQLTHVGPPPPDRPSLEERAWSAVDALAGAAVEQLRASNHNLRLPQSMDGGLEAVVAHSKHPHVPLPPGYPRTELIRASMDSLPSRASSHDVDELDHDAALTRPLAAAHREVGLEGLSHASHAEVQAPAAGVNVNGIHHAQVALAKPASRHHSVIAHESRHDAPGSATGTLGGAAPAAPLPSLPSQPKKDIGVSSRSSSGGAMRVGGPVPATRIAPLNRDDDDEYSSHGYGTGGPRVGVSVRGSGTGTRFGLEEQEEGGENGGDSLSMHSLPEEEAEDY